MEDMMSTLFSMQPFIFIIANKSDEYYVKGNYDKAQMNMEVDVHTEVCKLFATELSCAFVMYMRSMAFLVFTISFASTFAAGKRLAFASALHSFTARSSERFTLLISLSIARISFCSFLFHSLANSVGSCCLPPNIEDHPPPLEPPPLPPPLDPPLEPPLPAKKSIPNNDSRGSNELNLA